MSEDTEVRADAAESEAVESDVLEPKAAQSAPVDSHVMESVTATSESVETAPPESEATSRVSAPPERARAHPILGAVDVGVGLLSLGAIWFALPARWLPIDIGGSLLALGFVAAGVVLLLQKPWAPRIARWAALALLVPGAGLVTAIALAGADLFGRYGPVGMGGGLILFVVLLLLVPYLVLLPAAQIWILGRSSEARADESLEAPAS